MVSGSTIGIVGLGQIGSAVAKRAKGFEMKILYYNRNRREAEEKQLGNMMVHFFVMLCNSHLSSRHSMDGYPGWPFVPHPGCPGNIVKF